MFILDRIEEAIISDQIKTTSVIIHNPLPAAGVLIMGNIITQLGEEKANTDAYRT